MTFPEELYIKDGWPKPKFKENEYVIICTNDHIENRSKHKGKLTKIKEIEAYNLEKIGKGYWYYGIDTGGNMWEEYELRKPTIEEIMTEKL